MSFLMLFFALACADSTVATVNSTNITESELNLKFQRATRLFPASPPTKRQVLDDLIKRELIIQAARTTGLPQDPLIKEQMDQVLYVGYVEREMAKRFSTATVSDSEARSYYERYPEIRTSQIFIGVPPGATAEQEAAARKKIENLRTVHLKKGRSFSEVAQKYSEGISAPMGGDIDYQTADRLDPSYYEAARKLTVGGISPAVRTVAGYHIIKLTAVRSWADVERAKIKRIVLERKRQEAFEQLTRQLQSNAKVSVNESIFK